MVLNDMRRLAGIAVAIALIACQSAAGHANNSVGTSSRPNHTAPRGWTHTSSDGIQIYVAPETNRGNLCMICVMPDQPAGRDFKTWFKNETRDLMAGENVIETSESKFHKGKNGHDTLYQAVEVKANDGKPIYWLFIAVHHGKNAQMLTLCARDDKLFDRYGDTFTKFCGSFTFKD